jgi:uncharacterized membrane protein YbhN (UPF0104 family)
LRVVAHGTGAGREEGAIVDTPIAEAWDDPTPTSETVERERPKKKLGWRIAQIAFSIALTVGIFVFAIPKLADYSAAWHAVTRMSPAKLAILVGAMVFNLVTYWWQNMASMRGLGFFQAAVNNQTTTSVADTVPGGGYLAVGVGYTMYRSWGFSNSAIALSAAVTGIWNILMKLGLPVIALAVLAVTGSASASLVAASLIGLGVLVAAIVLLGLVLWKKELARKIGEGLGRFASAIRKLLRKPPVKDWGEAAVRFRHDTIELVAQRWVQLTLTTIVSHLALFMVLLLALRFVGVSQSEVSWAQALGVFAFGRLLTALPLTPGGLGLVELSYIGGLILAGRAHTDVPPDVFRAQVAGAVLLFRALTYGVQIPLGAFAYLIYRAKSSWRRPADSIRAEREAQPVAG